VLKHSPPNAKSRASRWLCQCKCGTKRVITGTALRYGHTKSCGCLQRELAHERHRLPDGVAAFRQLWSQYRQGARVRDLEWGLSKSTFRELTQQPCHYCGRLPEQESSTHSDTGAYIYNGVDRKNNDKGYIAGNVVPCCGTCNTAKMTMPYSDFIETAVQIAEYRIGI